VCGSEQKNTQIMNVSMTSALKPLIVGNWKMFGVKASLQEIDTLIQEYSAADAQKADLLVCSSATLLAAAADRVTNTVLQVGGQDCHPEPQGAFTGDISAEQLKDAGAVFVIVGHSERRQGHNETDSVVKAKAEAALRAGLTPILCIGESLQQREADDTLAVLQKQLEGSLPNTADLVIAYEPIWAIGTGLTPTTDQVAEVHNALRLALVTRFGETGNGIKVLYGGSVKPENAAELLAVPNVNGVLVGGASLKAVDFLKIARSVA
jgi:triosephosphate isomerase (TIM)